MICTYCQKSAMETCDKGQLSTRYTTRLEKLMETWPVNQFMIFQTWGFIPSIIWDTNCSWFNHITTFNPPQTLVLCWFL